MKIMVPNAVFYGDFSGAIEFSLSRTVQNLCRSKFGKMYQNSYFTAFSTFGANRVQPNGAILIVPTVLDGKLSLKFISDTLVALR